MKRIMTLFLMVVIILGSFTACGDPAKKLEGSWRLSDGGAEEIVTFYSNGTISYDGDTATYFVEDGNLVILSDGEMEAIPYEISGSTLTVYENGYTLQFEKVR